MVEQAMDDPAQQHRSRKSGIGKPVLGLLGAPGAGKSTVARAIRDEGALVIDADRLARQAFHAPKVRDKLITWWGDEILDEDGRVDRRKVGKIVFTDPAQRKQLESLIHPFVCYMRETKRRQAVKDPEIRAVVEDCPLLIETALEQTCDYLVYVDAPFQVRLKRVQESRGWDEQELRRRENNQAALDIKRKAADYVIDNSDDEHKMQLQVSRTFTRILDDFSTRNTERG